MNTIPNYKVRAGDKYVIAESCHGEPIPEGVANKWLDELREHYSKTLASKKKKNGDYNIYYEPNPIGVMTDMNGKKVPSSDPKYWQEYNRLRYGHSINECRTTYNAQRYLVNGKKVNCPPRVIKEMYITLPPSKLGYQMAINLTKKEFIILADLLPTDW